MPAQAGRCSTECRLTGTTWRTTLKVWQDTERGYYLYIAHPYCDCSECDSYEEDVAKLAERGLTCRKSSASWYSPGRASLTLIGRPDIVEAVDLGDDELGLPMVKSLINDRELSIRYQGFLDSSAIDAEMIEAKRLAEEQVLRGPSRARCSCSRSRGRFPARLVSTMRCSSY